MSEIFIKSILILFFIHSNGVFSQIILKSKNNMEILKTEDEKSKIIAVSRQLTQMMIEKDSEGIEKIVDEDFTLTHITGFVQTKKDWLREIETESMKYYSYKEVKMSVEINDDKAIFIGQNLLDARIWGTRNNWRLQQTMQFEKRNGDWIILKSVAKIF